MGILIRGFLNDRGAECRWWRLAIPILEWVVGNTGGFQDLRSVTMSHTYAFTGWVPEGGVGDESHVS